ncbi:hypothetical protein [Engelhardtia mirabilis]|uniref:Uncharacterized protein n=1 Tax=Engelhardtia mirabilis TaxID=2528011 RepID=A0A518BMV5_9BACT|nr:hypothetical protein Pla133_33690 [Planctomycetes bacterium Pla133]QDV02599.1 hypothetical protein Pla86_33680 [Planctomycetes bacterium Pla86]
MVRSKRGEAQAAVLVGTVLVLLATTGAYIFLRTGRAPAPVAAAVGSGTSGASADSGDDVATVIAAPRVLSADQRTPDEPEPADEQESASDDPLDDLDGFLSGFYDSTNPDIDGLRALIAQFGAEAELVAGSLTKTSGGEWSGRLRIPSIGRSGSFTVGASSLDVDLEQPFGDRDFSRRIVAVYLGVDESGAPLEGNGCVWHGIDEFNDEVMDVLLDAPRTVGARLTVRQDVGTVVEPLLAVALDDEDGLRLVYGDEALEHYEEEQVPGSSRDEGAVDFSAWYGWRDFHAHTLALAQAD